MKRKVLVLATFVGYLGFMNPVDYSYAQQYECKSGAFTYYSSTPCPNIPPARVQEGRSYRNEPDGFRGLKWGADIFALTDMRFFRTDPSFGGLPVYERNGDSLEIGGARLERIEYTFWRGKLFSVTIRVIGYQDWATLKAATFEKFGKGYQPNRFMEKYHWFGDISTLFMEYNEVSRSGKLFIFSKEMSRQIEAYQKEKAQEGATKGF